MRKILLAAALLSAFAACQTGGKFVNKDVPNTPAVGFDTEGSDAKAIELADLVMKACGGRYAWDQTRYLHWTSFGNRDLVWDKKMERVRIDFLTTDMKIRLDLKTMTGRIFKDGKEILQTDSLKKYLEIGKDAWINDSYWFLMPFKMKDSGVTLTYIGTKKNALNVDCDVVQMTFKSVGSRYWVYINPSSHLVVQWDYFQKSDDAKPTLSTPWADYRGLGNVMLAVSRGEGRSMAPMGVYRALPDSVFTSFYPINWSKIK